MGRQCLHVRQRFAEFAARDRAVGDYLYAGALFNGVKLRLKRLYGVRHRLQIGHGADGAISAVSCGAAAGFDILLIRKTRFAEMNVHVRETGKNMEGIKAGRTILRGE